MKKTLDFAILIGMIIGASGEKATINKEKGESKMRIKFKKGWLAMNANGDWMWFPQKPIIEGKRWVTYKICDTYPQKIVYLDIPKAKDWTKSLKEV